jgi:hypothetical protein
MEKEKQIKQITSSLQELSTKIKKERFNALSVMNDYQRLRNRMTWMKPEFFPIDYSDVISTIEYFDHRQIMLEKFTIEIDEILKKFYLI